MHERRIVKFALLNELHDGITEWRGGRSNGNDDSGHNLGRGVLGSITANGDGDRACGGTLPYRVDVKGHSSVAEERGRCENHNAVVELDNGHGDGGSSLVPYPLPFGAVMHDLSDSGAIDYVAVRALLNAFAKD